VNVVNEVEAYEAVCQRWKEKWDELHSTDPEDASYCPYVFENKKFPEPAPRHQWARVTMRSVDSQQHTLGTLGSRQFLREAMVWVQVFRPVGEGMATVRALVDDVREVFEAVKFGGIEPAGAGRMITTGPNPDGGQKFSPNDGHWMEVVVMFPVVYYETR
jgi:hypothetical protein